MPSPVPLQTSTRDRYVGGVDFGTLSGRAVVVRVTDGAELGSAVSPYGHAVVDRALPATGASLPPDWALQVPGDWLDVLRTAVPEALGASGVDPADVIGIGQPLGGLMHRLRALRRDAVARAGRRQTEPQISDVETRPPSPGSPP